MCVGKDSSDKVRYSTSIRGDPCVTFLLDHYNGRVVVDESVLGAGRATEPIRIRFRLEPVRA